MKYIVDIDNTICDNKNSDYPNSEPRLRIIDNINRLFDQGHEIHYWTARGGSSGKDWHDFTVKQLAEWGCKYTSFRSDKPSYDVWVDDKALHPQWLTAW